MNRILFELRNKWRGLREVMHFSNWMELVLGLTFFRRTRLKVYRTGRYEFVCDHARGDENSVRAAVATPMYRQLLTGLPADRSLTVLDFGANAGGFSALLLAGGYRLRRVWAVEMNPFTFHRLAFNLSQNLGQAGRAFHAALSGRDEILQLNLGRGSTSDSLWSADAGGEPVQVRSLTFDSFWREHVGTETVDLCKIDVEGAEFEALVDGESTMLAGCRRCIIEVHPRKGRQPAEIAAVFARLGFVRTVGADEPEPGENTLIWAWAKEIP